MEILKSPSVAPVIASLPSLQQQIYQEVREAFVRVTEAGVYYMADEDDEIVMMPVAEMHHLTVAEVASHYCAAECSIAEFQAAYLGSSPPADFEKWAMKKGNTVVSRYDDVQKCIMVSINGCKAVPYHELPVSSFSELFRSYTFSSLFK
ncbi:hypothetical protein [Terribacillus saccharophilus]|uniref:Uncharacterized protein n=1 Tax=Terribacillus saccharophilus TaxID=361277 RepID=A0ABX4H157_9BACI|nr:hypothetical protein [Terribacillus saccharophilus]PAD36399.1 hypothetical protein CHH56_04770 [Terribacillus saccharophilus]PAD94953.1 hypothetical protein CHH50_15720 [Terribacillus saccharophilus]PAE00804.1 hypothetical protein CHH48_05475 [Terribacillus saccharophilus]